MLICCTILQFPSFSFFMLAILQLCKSKIFVCKSRNSMSAQSTDDSSRALAPIWPVLVPLHSQDICQHTRWKTSNLSHLDPEISTRQFSSPYKSLSKVVQIPFFLAGGRISLNDCGRCHERGAKLSWQTICVLSCIYMIYSLFYSARWSRWEKSGKAKKCKSRLFRDDFVSRSDGSGNVSGMAHCRVKYFVYKFWA